MRGSRIASAGKRVGDHVAKDDAAGNPHCGLRCTGEEPTAATTGHSWRHMRRHAVDGLRVIRLRGLGLRTLLTATEKAGQVGEVGARVGQYVSIGTQLMALVPDRVWVVANFKETQLAGMREGQAVTFTVDALQHTSLSGHIERFAPAAGSEFSVLKADNATGNFTKVAQRVPVRISVDPGQRLVDRLAPGMSVVVTADTSASAKSDDVASTGAVSLR